MSATQDNLKDAKRPGCFRTAVMSAAVAIVLAGLFYVIVIRSRMSYSFEFLKGHHPIFSGMTRDGIDVDVDIYTWKESWYPVARRASNEFRASQDFVESHGDQSFSTADGINVNISHGRWKSPDVKGIEWAWVTVKVYKPLPNNWFSTIRRVIEDLLGNHRHTVVF